MYIYFLKTSTLVSLALKHAKFSAKSCAAPLHVQEKIKAQQAAEAAKRKALHAELLRKSEEEHAQIRLRKIKEYKEKKVRSTSIL